MAHSTFINDYLLNIQFHEISIPLSNLFYISQKNYVFVRCQAVDNNDKHLNTVSIPSERRQACMGSRPDQCTFRISFWNV
jgi:hypothetical protein